VQTLEIVRNILLIFSAVAAPLAVALSPAHVQKSNAHAALQKDYVQIALGALREPKRRGASLTLASLGRRHAGNDGVGVAVSGAHFMRRRCEYTDHSSLPARPLHSAAAAVPYADARCAV
jgi:hypothetical protein